VPEPAPGDPEQTGRFAFIDHTGDIGIRIWSATPAGIFATAARGLFSLICDLDRVAAAQTRRIEVSAPSPAELLVAWLAELNLIFHLEGLILSQFAVISLKDNKIEADVAGEPIAEKHEIMREIKAITYHALQFEQRGSDWMAQVILDL
jgi:SHS2 domain-containing protein